MATLHIERDADGIPTQEGSAAIKMALKAFWVIHGKDAKLSDPLQLVVDHNPLEMSEALEEFALHGA